MRTYEPNKHLFDCRKFILVGDIISFDSMKACDTVQQVDRHSSTIPYEGLVVDVHESFVIVQLKKLRECVNRWDITKINGRPVGSKGGYFGGFAVRA